MRSAKGRVALWLVQLDVLDRECFTRSVRTNPRYPEIYCAVLDDAARARLLELMQPGTLILQSKERAICQRVRLTRRDRAGARERGPSRARSRALAVRIDAFAPASAALAPCCLPHPYLILSRGRADASDGSDSLVAVNLSRPMRLSAHADRDVVAQSHALHHALQPGARCGRAASVAPAWRPMPPGAAAMPPRDMRRREPASARRRATRAAATASAAL